jgi:hypothetical protein
MLILNSVGDSIEGEKIELQCRKFQPHTPRRDAKMGCLVHPFKLSIFGKAWITEAYVGNKTLFCEGSKLELSDEVRGEAIDGFALRLLGKPAVVNATSSHKATSLRCRGGVYAHVEIGVREQLQAKKKPALGRAEKVSVGKLSQHS